MTTLRFVLLATAIHFLAANHSFAQGCSDAGFCTINSFKPNSIDSTDMWNNQIKVGTFFGKADHTISVYGTYLEYNRQLSNKFGLDTKLSSLAQSGNGISAFGLSDIFLNAHYKVSETVKYTLGAKIPMSSANKTENNFSLPMDYQASLGTLDLILGIGFEIRKFQLVAAIQQPLTQNDNQFFASNHPANSILRTFQSTNKFERSGDVLIRVSYPIVVNSKFTLTPSILPIFHLAHDKYTDENNIVKKISGSQGITVNGNVYLDYKINSRNMIQCNVASPFVVRDVRPDGLTRSIIANLEYRMKF